MLRGMRSHNIVWMGMRVTTEKKTKHINISVLLSTDYDDVGDDDAVELMSSHRMYIRSFVRSFARPCTQLIFDQQCGDVHNAISVHLSAKRDARALCAMSAVYCGVCDGGASGRACSAQCLGCQMITDII